jgi:regulatory protein
MNRSRLRRTLAGAGGANRKAKSSDRPSLPRTAFDDALHSLARRRLTEAEIRSRLVRRHGETEVEEAVAKLKDYRFLDDAALITDYTRDRLRLSPRSAELIEAELERRGIESDTFRSIFVAEFPDYEELEVARRALNSQAKALLKSPSQGRRERALRFLRNRGFSYEAMLQAWELFRREAKATDEQDEFNEL